MLSLEMEKADIFAICKECLKRSHVRWSFARRVIIKMFVELNKHASAQEILEEVRTVAPNTHINTVYSTMDLLIKEGLVVRHIVDDKTILYDLLLGKGLHFHLQDEQTGMIIEFIDEELMTTLDRIAAERGYIIAYANVFFTGFKKKKPKRRHRSRLKTVSD
jgi:Fe2+ or Zn2+ uptake regulation protein